MKTSTLLKSAATAVFVVAGALGATLWAHESLAQGPFASAHGMPRGGQHLAQMAAHIKVAANTTPEQGARIDALIAQATTDLQALHAQAAPYHDQVHAMLGQDRIDRAALENERVAIMSVVDQGSRRMTQLIADVAEVLTPEQRRSVVAQMQAMHGAH